MKKHVFGMAKSHTDLKGAKGPKLELDLLRLVYAVKSLRVEGDRAESCLVVMTDDIAKRVNGWIIKYTAKGAVEVIVANLSNEELNLLRDEKDSNVRGMIAGTLGEAVEGQSDAHYGKSIGEAALRRHIQENHPDVSEVTDKVVFPFKIEWDYYGTSDES